MIRPGRLTRGALSALAAGALAAGTPARAAPPPAAAPTNAEIEELAFKTYLYSRIGDKENALAYGGRVLEQRPDHPGVLLALAALWESTGEPERLAPIADRLLAVMPDGDQALFFKAASELMLRHYAEARRTLLENRRLNHPAPHPYPYNAALAASALRAGDWRTALFAHESIAREGASYETLANNRRAYDGLLREHRRELATTFTAYAAPDRHRIAAFDAQYTEYAGVRTRILAGVTARDSALAAGDGWRAGTRDRTAGRVGIEHLATALCTLSGSVGADSFGEPDARFAVTTATGRTGEADLSAVLNAPAFDDVPYALADIRSTEVTIGHADRLSDRTGYRIAGGARSLHTDGTGPADWGGVFSGEIHHTVRQRTPRFTPYLQSLWIVNPDNPRVSAALGEYRADGAPQGIDGGFDLQKAGLRTECPLRRKFLLVTDVYAGTSLLDGGLLGGVTGELRWRPVKTLSLGLTAGWDKGTVLNNFPGGIARAGASLDWLF